jgi:hypothetical protein
VLNPLVKYKRDREKNEVVGNIMGMNVFRLAGDMSHLFSIIVLLLRLRVARNAQGKPLVLGKRAGRDEIYRSLACRMAPMPGHDLTHPDNASASFWLGSHQCRQESR